MEQLDLLIQEMDMIKENIQRIKKYQRNNKENRPYNSLVVGELKHRLMALKQRINLASGITTMNLWE